MRKNVVKVTVRENITTLCHLAISTWAATTVGGIDMGDCNESAEAYHSGLRVKHVRAV